jgi:hypothetical protein
MHLHQAPDVLRDAEHASGQSTPAPHKATETHEGTLLHTTVLAARVQQQVRDAAAVHQRVLHRLVHRQARETAQRLLLLTPQDTP